MIGHEPLIAMRRRGRAPAWVEIETMPCADSRLAREWPQFLPQRAMLFVDPRESAARLDLRCVVGLCVDVQGEDAKRVSAVVAAAESAGARRVLGSVFRRRGELCETVSRTDTEGRLTWPE